MLPNLSGLSLGEATGGKGALRAPSMDRFGKWMNHAKVIMSRSQQHEADERAAGAQFQRAVEQHAQKQRKAVPSSDESPIMFKAYINGDFRKLSNLFGPVEWKYQQTKFKPGSAVYEYLQQCLDLELNGQWDSDVGGNFDTVRKALGHNGKLASYVAPDRTPATGLLAQQTSVIARNPASDNARKRLTFIRRQMGEWTALRNMNTREVIEWHADNVNPAANDEKAAADMLKFLREKYSIPEYAGLLLSTGERELHEAPPGRGGSPGLWEYGGGDLLGKLLTQVRTELQRKVRGDCAAA